MKFVYLLVQVSFLTFISGADDENSNSPSESEDIFWEVYFLGAPESGKTDIRKVHLYPDLFKDETAAFIIEHSERPTEDVPSRRSIYYWFGKNVSPVLRTETVRYVAYIMQSKNPKTPAVIPIHRCVSGLEPKEFQMITDRPFADIPVKKLYKLKGKTDFMIARVPVTLNELTKMDPFVLSTKNHVFIFVPLEANAIKNNKALIFGFYLSDFEYKKEKKPVYIDCRSNFYNQKEEDFNSFLNEIDPEYKLSDHLLEMLYSLCNVASKSDVPNQKTSMETMLNVDALIKQEDEEFEKKRKNIVQVASCYYDYNEGVMNGNYYKKGTRLKDIIDETETAETTASHTLYVTGDENDDRFIYLGSRSVYEEVTSALQYGETQSENWQNLKIVQSPDIPVDFIILFPDCWKLFPGLRYVNLKLKLLS